METYTHVKLQVLQDSDISSNIPQFLFKYV